MKITSITAFMFLSLQLLAQVDSSVAFISYWSNGDSYDFEITTSRQQWKDEELVKNDSSTALINFTVIDSSETSYTIRWTKISNLANLNVPIPVAGLFDHLDTIEVDYKTSEVGDFLEILNWEDVSKQTIETLDNIIALMKQSSPIDMSKIDDVMKPIRKMYKTKEGIEGLLFKDIRLFHFPLGIELPVFDTTEYVEMLPNMLGGEPLEGDAMLYFDHVDYDDYFCVLRNRLVLDPKKTKNYIIEFFSRLNLEDEEMERAMENSEMTIEDDNVYEYYYYPGIPHRIETNRNISMKLDDESTRRLDRTVIKLIYQD